VELPRQAFTARFGNPDTSAALCGFTPPLDTHAVLALVAHARPRRVLEIGTANGQMTANLTAFTPPDASVYSIGLVAEDRPRSGAPQQDSEIPARARFVQYVNHFGTAHKAQLIAADSRTFEFARLAPLDFVFVDGGRDLATARADALAAYRALRSGGLLVWHGVPSPVAWVAVERAIAELAFLEPVYRVGDTQVAFLVKGEGLGALATADSSRLAVTWDGAVDALHSLAHVNRSVCAELVERGHGVGLAPQPPAGVSAPSLPVPPQLAALVGREVASAVHVRHRWPPDFTPPGAGPFVLMQPWEFGRLPRSWVEPILTTVDEVWAYSRSVLRAYVASGVPESRIALIPLGVDPDRFRPGLEPLPLPTEKRTKLLFVGGTIPRKGFDALLSAYRRAFTRADDVCLVVKDLGAGTFYRDLVIGPALIAEHRADPDAPEVVYLTEDLTEDELPHLYAACDAVVLPYRGEGFGLPVLEAMACGLPVVVTAGGPTDEFVPLSAGWRVPGRLLYFPEEALRGEPTAGRPWLLEPDADTLVAVLKEVVASPEERRTRGSAARRAALSCTWARTAMAIEDRVRVLRARTPIRLARRPVPVAPALPARPIAPAPAETLSTPVPFAPALTLESNELIAAGPDAGQRAPAETALASLIVLCCNELDVTRLCVESALRHTRAPYELIFINNGSTDGTGAYLDGLVGRPDPERVVVIHNAENRGYPAGVNQGLAAARGAYLVLLNNDVVLTAGWLERLVRCAVRAGPNVGLVGPVTNYAPPPQLVQPGYPDLGGLDTFAAARATEYAGQVLAGPRLTGFCLLVTRAVFEWVGQLDEGFGLGFFDDDDLCLRARRSGYRLVVALDCYVHHFGSRTFRGLGVNTAQQLADNLDRYRAKWGAEEAARYALGGAPAGAGPTLAPRPRVAIPAVAGKPRVSLTMIVKNEEHNLGDCLASVRDLVDEAVVIDTGSTDRTREIAAQFGCVVGEFPWVDHFAAARNAALEKATGDYAFWMDADDRLDADNRHKLKALFEALPSGNAAFVMKCLCVGGGSTPSAAGTMVDHVRLFRLHPAHRWTYRIHEQILPAVRATGAEVSWADVCIRHVGYVNPAVRRRKLDRDLRLLKRDEAENPNEPFTLFNLGSVYHEIGQYREGARALEGSLASSHPGDSIVRKTYALLARCQYQLGDRHRAAATCHQGRLFYPDDAELLFLAAGYAREGGEYDLAEQLYRKLIDGSEGPHFASVDTSLRSVKGRHNLGVMLFERERFSEAEALWRAALVQDPHFLPAQIALGEAYIKTNNEAGVDRQVVALEGLGEVGAAEGAILAARWKATRGDHAGAAAVLEEAIQRLPRALGVRVALSHIHIGADSPPEVLERAFRGVLELDPNNAQARYNLELLYRKTGRWIEGILDGAGPNPAV
jgi:GT2 family glycosyltransferase/glycosyltransferase involved in cell wall biosynthesis/tetratricopeptide (TPR) repeat protein